MSNVIQEVGERLTWARGEIATIERDIAEWQRRSIKLLARPTPEQGFDAILVEISEEIPIGIRARSGTTANEMRACLDSLASFLAQRNGKVTAYFPVAKHEHQFATDKLLKERLKRFRPEDRDALLAWRPFAVGKDGQPGNLILFGLHHSDIKRKHHRLVAKTISTSLNVGNGYIGQLRPLNYDLRIPGTTRVALISKNSRVELAFEPLITYAEPDVLSGRPIVETLYDLANVTEAVIRSFL